MIRIATSLVCFLLLVIMSCSSGPKPIDYDEDQCDRCKMIISQKPFGAEVITLKGRVYKYDAIECLLPVVLENGESHYSHILVTDYLNPGKFIDAKQAHYLISESLPSPMGGFLSAYASLNTVQEKELKHAGRIHDWNSILINYNQ